MDPNSCTSCTRHVFITYSEWNPSCWGLNLSLCNARCMFAFCFPLQFSSISSLDCFFFPLHIQPPREEYWSFQCTNYPAWPWMSLWTAVSLLIDMSRYLAVNVEKREKRSCFENVGFWLLIFVKRVRHPLKWPICLSAVTSCAIEWALNLADQLLLCGCVCMRAVFTYASMHMW